MNELIVNCCIFFAIIAAFLVARPWLSRKNVLFGVVFGSPDVRNQPEAKKIIRHFVIGCVAVAVVVSIGFSLYSVMSSADVQGTASSFAVS
ncbi:MAG: hypothetical protein WCP73_05895, partial [Eubacteriales bacterium]